MEHFISQMHVAQDINTHANRYIFMKKFLSPWNKPYHHSSNIFKKYHQKTIPVESPTVVFYVMYYKQQNHTKLIWNMTATQPFTPYTTKKWLKCTGQTGYNNIGERTKKIKKVKR